MKVRSFTTTACTVLVISGALYFYLTQEAPPINNEHVHSSEDVQSNTSFSATKSAIVIEEDLSSTDVSAQDVADGEVSPFPKAVNTMGLASIYPKKPDEMYLENIEAAENGDSSAQFKVGRALRECSSYTTNDRLEDLRTENKYPEWVMRDLEAQKEKCDALATIVPPAHLTEWDTHYSWMDKSFKAGDPIAAVWHLSTHPDRYSEAEVRKILINTSLAPREDKQFVYSQMPFIVSNFFGQDEDLASAWEYASCSSRDWCDKAVMQEYLRQHELPHIADEVISQAKSIENAIQNNEIEKLFDF